MSLIGIINTLALTGLLFVVRWVHCTTDEGAVQVTAIEGNHLTLRCTSATSGSSNPKNVEWVDLVYNSSPEPQKIFTKKHNSNRNIDPSHPNARNYKVDGNFSLTISNISMSNDPGRYTCISTWSSVEKSTNEYYLSVATHPICSGEVDLVEGLDDGVLECGMKFSGTQPDLHWYHGDEELLSEDHFDVLTAMKRLKVRATHHHDKVRYTCKVNFGDMKESCSLKMNISYLVREVKISPDKDKIMVGDEVKCTAKGNPTPEITLLPQGEESGPGRRTLRVDESMVGSTLEVKCSATNSKGTHNETSTRVYHIEQAKPSNKNNVPREDEQSAKHEDVRPVNDSPNSADQKNIQGYSVLTLLLLTYTLAKLH